MDLEKSAQDSMKLVMNADKSAARAENSAQDTTTTAKRARREAK
jgi:hypothetical protein